MVRGWPTRRPWPTNSRRRFWNAAARRRLVPRFRKGRAITQCAAPSDNTVCPRVVTIDPCAVNARGQPTGARFSCGLPFVGLDHSQCRDQSNRPRSGFFVLVTLRVGRGVTRSVTSTKMRKSLLGGPSSGPSAVQTAATSRRIPEGRLLSGWRRARSALSASRHRRASRSRPRFSRSNPLYQGIFEPPSRVPGSPSVWSDKRVVTAFMRAVTCATRPPYG